MRFARLALLLAALASVNVAAGQSQPVSSADRVAREKLALGRARAAAAQRIRSLPLAANLTLGEWAERGVELDRGLRAWTRSLPRAGDSRSYDDGAVEATVHVRPAEVLEQVRKLRAAHPKIVFDASDADLAKTAAGWPEIWADAAAEPTDSPDPAAAPGWEDISPEGAQLARLAATTDAIAAMLDEAGRLRVTSAHRLNEFIFATPEIRDAVGDAIRRSASITVELGPDQIAAATATLSITELTRIVSEVHAARYREALFRAADFRQMSLTNDVAELRVAGLASPPNQSRVKPRYQRIELDRPSWADKTLTAEGRYQPEDGDPFAISSPASLARLDAVDALRRQVLALVVQRDVTVEQLLAQRPELKADVVRTLSGARLLSATPPDADGVIRARVELSLGRLWKIVQRGMRSVEVDPPAASAPVP
jgi:hypothetical protein